MRSLWPMGIAVVLAACGLSKTPLPGPPDSTQNSGRRCMSHADCPPGETCLNLVCGAPHYADAGDDHPKCQRDDQCPMGYECVRSTGDCLQVKEVPNLDVDAGRPASCTEGEVVSCGTAKLGECRLGSAHCLNLDGAWRFGPCE